MSKLKLKSKSEDLSTAELVAQGSRLMAAGSYREAIEIYKQLLKREQRQEWRDTLATAYLERSRDLAAKAMYREAAMLWENIVNLCGTVLQPDWYIDWLIRGGQYAKAMWACQQYQAALTAGGTHEQLDMLLAALLLIGNKEVTQALPPDSALRQQQAMAQAALRAYCQGGNEAVIREHLKGITFRSPYREWRQILSALLKLESDPAGAPLLLERISPESPYHDLAEVIRRCAHAGNVQALLRLNPAQRDLAASLLGFDQGQLKLLRQWSGVSQKLNDRTMFDFITNHLPVLDQEQARHACLSLLPGYPHGLKTYTRLFGPLPPFETQRLQALRAEREGDTFDASRYWQTCVDLLMRPADNPDNPLAAALILRHMAKLRERSGSGPQQETSIRNYLERSLELDPDDKATYLKLADLHKQAGNAKDYYQWLEKAVQQFPNDSQVLLAIVEAATARKAFKKAAGFAARLLELDPINTKARTVLINSHLGHARKLIKSGKYPLAEKELASASQLERESARRGLVEINRGLLAFQLGQQERMQRELREGARLAGGVLQASLCLWVESCRLELEPEDFQRYAQPEGVKLQATREEVLALVKLVNEYRQEGADFLDTALENLEAPLKKFASQLSTEEDLLAVCECLQRAPHYELLEHFASQALKRWPERPLFVYYQLYGRAEGNLDNLSERDHQHLERVWQQAEQAKDHRTARLIDSFLNQDFSPLTAPFPSLPPLPPEVREGLEKLRRELRNASPKLRDKLMDDFLDGVFGRKSGKLRALDKVVLTLLLAAGTEDESLELPLDFLEPPDEFLFPFDLPEMPRPAHKKSKRRR
jgi:tetratricopeptide (TPR) repeat protein